MEMWTQADEYADANGLGVDGTVPSTGLAPYMDDHRLRVLVTDPLTRRDRLGAPAEMAEWLGKAADGRSSLGPWVRMIPEGATRYSSPNQVGTPWSRAAAVHWNGAFEFAAALSTWTEHGTTWFDPENHRDDIEDLVSWSAAVTARLEIEGPLLTCMEVVLPAGTAGRRRGRHVSDHELTTAPRSRLTWRWVADGAREIEAQLSQRLSSAVGLTVLRGHA